MSNRDSTAYSTEHDDYDPDLELRQSIDDLKNILGSDMPHDEQGLQMRAEQIHFNVEKMTEAIFDSSEVFDPEAIEAVQGIKESLIETSQANYSKSTNAEHKINDIFETIHTQLNEVYHARAEFKVATEDISTLLMTADATAHLGHPIASDA